MIGNMVKFKDKLIQTARNGLAAAEVKLGLERHQALVERIKHLEQENRELRETVDLVRKRINKIHTELSESD
mgnify:CR=1 FL=1